MFWHTHLHTVWPFAVIYHTHKYSHLYQGKQAILGSSCPSSYPTRIYSTEPISAPVTVHPLISHHFTQLSASTSLFLLITRNNPPKSLSRSVFPNSQTRNGTTAAQPLVQTSRRDQSVWWMHTHLWEISSVDKMNTYWVFLGFFLLHFPHCCELSK